MYLLYFLASLPVPGEELSSCTGVWMTEIQLCSQAQGCLAPGQNPELEGRDLLGCSAGCDTFVSGLLSPPHL